MTNRRKLLQGTAALTVLSAAPQGRASAPPIGEVALTAWTGPLASPRFDRVQTVQFEPAFETAFDQHLREIGEIADSPAKPSFDNTVVALERSGRPLSKVDSVFNALTGTMSNDVFQTLEQSLSPKLAAHADAVSLRPGLYARVAAVRLSPGRSLTPEQTRLIERYDVQLTRSGARLGGPAKTRLMAINTQLASLYTRFSQNQLAEENDWTLPLAEADLEGLPDGLKTAAAGAAAEKGKSGHLVTLARSSVEPFLTASPRRDLREKAWRAWIMRGDNGNAHDNKAIITQILALRAERAKLLGYPTHAHYQLADSMAKTPEAALALMQAIWKPAVAAALSDRDSFQAMIDAERGGFKVQPWDWRYYAEKVRKAKYDVDESEVKSYLQLAKFREATFYAANKLYGLSFEPRTDVPVYHPDVKVWTVKGPGGEVIGLFYFDPYARAGKRSGAWMNEFRSEEHFDGRVLPLIVNVTNFSKPAPGEPALLSLDDAVTTFHEFGHGLHGLLSRAAYPTLSGTNVSRDFVEFPSQINEHWATRPEILERFAVHYKTGRPMPKALIDRIVRAKTFNQGFQTVEYIASAWVDMDMHLAGGQPIEPDAFEKTSLAKLGMPSEIVMRHRPTHFGHVFADDGYSAGYYAYLWSQVLDNDGFAAFEESGDVFDPATSKRFKDEVLTRGNTRDPAESYRGFRGRDPKIDALLRNRGFA